MRIFSSILKGLAAIFAAAIFIVGVGAALSFLPERTGLRAFVVLSGSMEPAIPTGSLVIVSRRDLYRVGDVVTRRAPGRSSNTITHRIADISEEQGRQIFHTKGDANESADEEAVRKEDIVGRVTLSVPYLGYPVHAARTPIGFLLLIVLPGIAIIVDETFSLARVFRDRKRHTDSSSESIVFQQSFSSVRLPQRSSEGIHHPVLSQRDNIPTGFSSRSSVNRSPSFPDSAATHQSARRRKIV